MYKFDKSNVLLLKHRNKFLKKDIGSIFWRVNSEGGMFQEYKIKSVDDLGEAKVTFERIDSIDENEDWELTDYKKENNESSMCQYFSMSTIRKKCFYIDFKIAKEISEKSYYKFINPRGKYIVNKYFDDIFDEIVCKNLTRKEAISKCNSLNKNNTYIYTSFVYKEM